MTPQKTRCSFLTAEDGGVTIDWLVLCAAVVALGIAVMVGVSDGSTSMAQNTAATMDAMD